MYDRFPLSFVACFPLYQIFISFSCIFPFFFLSRVFQVSSVSVFIIIFFSFLRFLRPSCLYFLSIIFLSISCIFFICLFQSSSSSFYSYLYHFRLPCYDLFSSSIVVFISSPQIFVSTSCVFPFFILLLQSSSCFFYSSFYHFSSSPFLFSTPTSL